MELLSEVPSNTIISVFAPANDITLPDELTGSVCESFVNNAVTAFVPAVPSAPPTTLNIFTESVNPSFVAVIVIGSLVVSPPTPPALVALAKVIEPLTIPVPFVTSLLSNVNPVIWLLPLSLTSISELPIVMYPAEPLRFCCWKLNSIDDGS